MNDFYEEDEPTSEIVAAFKRGKKGVTAPPPHVELINVPDSVSHQTTTAGSEVRLHVDLHGEATFPAASAA